jgi:hypothetical protein
MNKQCMHYKKVSQIQRNYCEEGVLCQYGNLVPLDYNIIEAAFNIFIILVELKAYYPKHHKLEHLRFDISDKLEIHKKHRK